MEALAALAGMVRRRVASLLRSRPHEIDDCVQETMLEAFRSVERHGAPAYPKAWLTRIAEHMAYRGGNRCRRRQSIEDALEHYHGATTGTVLNDLVKSHQEARLRGVVESLSERDHSVVSEYYWQDRSCSEIGQQMGTTGEAVKTRLHRSRAELARRMASEEEKDQLER